MVVKFTESFMPSKWANPSHLFKYSKAKMMEIDF